MKSNKVKTFDGVFWATLSALVLFVGTILFFPILFTQNHWGFDFTGTGQIGDTIGGIVGPFVAIAAALLTFLAFWVQFKANEQQRKDIELERFENRFFELVRWHRENVDSLSIYTQGDSVAKRKVFVSMFNEFRYIYYCSESKISRPVDELVNISYIVFYSGVGDASNPISYNHLTKAGCPSKIQDDEYQAIIGYLENIRAYKESKVINIPIFPKQNSNQKVELNIRYKPFVGHQSRLGHYYRHLFELIKYVDEQFFLTNEQKQSYLNILRAQLSNHEQLLLCYYAISSLAEKEWLGKDESEGYIKKYRLVQDVPLGLLDFGITDDDKKKLGIE